MFIQLARVFIVGRSATATSKNTPFVLFCNTCNTIVHLSNYVPVEEKKYIVLFQNNGKKNKETNKNNLQKQHTPNNKITTTTKYDFRFALFWISVIFNTISHLHFPKGVLRLGLFSFRLIGSAMFGVTFNLVTCVGLP